MRYWLLPLLLLLPFPLPLQAQVAETLMGVGLGIQAYQAYQNAQSLTEPTEPLVPVEAPRRPSEGTELSRYLNSLPSPPPIRLSEDCRRSIECLQDYLDEPLPSGPVPPYNDGYAWSSYRPW